MRQRNNTSHGGKRKGAGRKPGKKAYKNVKPRPTKIMRIPTPLVDIVKEMIERYYENQK